MMTMMNMLTSQVYDDIKHVFEQLAMQRMVDWDMGDVYVHLIIAVLFLGSRAVCAL